MTIAPSRRMTLDEFLALPEEKPYLEYIRGEILPKPVPTRPHGRLVSRLLLRLGSYLEESEEAIVETEVRHVNRDEERVFLPDISVTLNERASQQVRGAIPEMPDFAIEVLSTDDRTVRVLDKVDFYLRNGVQLVWLIDPLERTVGVYRPGKRAAIAEAGDTIDARPVLASFELALDDLFSVLPEQEEAPGSS